MFYAFESRTIFMRLHNKQELEMVSQNKKKMVYFKHVNGTPNPWFCHLVDEKGKKISDKVYTYSSLGKYLDEAYKVKKKK